MDIMLVCQNRISPRTLPTTEYHALGFLVERCAVEDVHTGVQRFDEALFLLAGRRNAYCSRHHLIKCQRSRGRSRPNGRCVASGILRTSDDLCESRVAVDVLQIALLDVSDSSDTGITTGNDSCRRIAVDGKRIAAAVADKATAVVAALQCDRIGPAVTVDDECVFVGVAEYALQAQMPAR